MEYVELVVGVVYVGDCVELVGEVEDVLFEKGEVFEGWVEYGGFGWLGDCCFCGWVGGEYGWCWCGGVDDVVMVECLFGIGVWIIGVDYVVEELVCWWCDLDFLCEGVVDLWFEIVELVGVDICGW